MKHNGPKIHGTQPRNSKKEIHSNTGLPKKDKKISNKQPNPMPTRTRGTTAKIAQSKQKEGNNQDESRIK